MTPPIQADPQATQARVRIQPVVLSKDQKRDLLAGYEDQRVRTDVLVNLINYSAPDANLILLPGNSLKPTHFPYEGNRRYRMQLVSNGEVFAMLSQEAGSRQPTTYRAEIVMESDLEFAMVPQAPTREQVRSFYADLVAYHVAQFDQADLNPEQREAWWSFGESSANGTNRAERAQLYREQDAREILSDFIVNGPKPKPKF